MIDVTEELLAAINFLGLKGNLKVVYWISGSNAAWTLPHDKTSSTLCTKFNGHSKICGEHLQKVWYSLGFVEIVKLLSTFFVYLW